MGCVNRIEITTIKSTKGYKKYSLIKKKKKYYNYSNPLNIQNVFCQPFVHLINTFMLYTKYYLFIYLLRCILMSLLAVRTLSGLILRMYL